MRFRVQASERRERKFYKLSRLKGVDYSSSPLDVSSHRATDINNLLLEDGALHKRHGWEQVWKLSDSSGKLAYVNGAWVYENGSDKFLIAHVGKEFYRIDSENGDAQKLTTGMEGILSVKSFSCVKDMKMYIVCGKLCVFEEDKTGYSFNVIGDNTVPYVPVTRQNIFPIGMENPLGEQSVYSPNLLTNWRKNILVGKDTTNELRYQLDSTVDIDEVSGGVNITITNQYGEKYFKKLYFVRSHLEGNVVVPAYWESDDGKTRVSFGGVLTISAGFNPFNHAESGIKDLEIIVEFHRSVIAIPGKDSPLNIGKCTSGVIFGVNGKNDRLFLGGHPDNPNICYYSELDNLTYFPPENQIVCGEGNSRIKAFCRLGDGTLAVLKNSDNSSDASVYYITGNTMAAPEDKGGNELVKEYFSVKAGAIGESCVSAGSVANLSGDSLFASENGVYGIVLSNNVATDERFARERSRTINAKLARLDLSDSSAIVYKNKYYLSIGNETNECYVADARYRYTLDDDMDDTYNYEWFRLTNIPARVWFIMDGKLCFGTSDGWICRFTDGYSDIYKTTEGQATVSSNGESLGEYIVTFDENLYNVISEAAYALDGNGNKWRIEGLTESSFKVPKEINVSEGSIVLRFAHSVKAFWYSPIFDFETSVYRKCLWSMTISVTPSTNCSLTMGYKTRQGMSLPIQAEGAETFDFGDIDFQFFSFDCGGFETSFRLPIFERGFVYAQAMFDCKSDSDCIVNEIVLEYSVTNKNIGVG